jgi:hypothetical protein
VVGGSHLRRGPVHHLPHPGAEVEQGVVVDPERPGLVDERLPHQPSAHPEGAEQVVDREALLGPPAAGGAGGVVVLLALTGLTADELQDAREVVVAGPPQVRLGDHPAAPVARVALLDGQHQTVGEAVHPAQHPSRQRLRDGAPSRLA